MVGKYCVPGVNENGESLINLCCDWSLVLMNTWFNKRNIYKYIWVSEVNGVNALIDYIYIRL